MTRSVICGADHSPSAHTVVEAAAALAEAIDARLILAHATRARSVPLARATPHPGFPGWAPSDPTRGEDGHDLLARLLPHAGSALAEAVLLDDEPATALCDLAEAVAAELVVVGSRGMGAFESVLVGSVSADVTRRAPCPVVVIPHAALGDVERPLVDGSTIVCGIGTEGDRRLGGLAGSLASGLGLRLRLAHVLAPLQDMVPPPVTGAVGPVLAPSALPATLAAAAPVRSPEVPQLLGNVLNEILDAYPDLEGRADWCIRSGDTGAELAELAAASRAAAIVVGTGGQGLLRAAVTRSPASLLARAATVPVVISRHETD